MTCTLAGDGTRAVYHAGAWEMGIVRGSVLTLAGEQVVAARQAAIADPQGGSTNDAEARQAVIAILAALRNHGLIER